RLKEGGGWTRARLSDLAVFLGEKVVQNQSRCRVTTPPVLTSYNLAECQPNSTKLRVVVDPEAPYPTAPAAS
ncbi:hypothetical protein M9458_053740, partial [Cirrhinus mrigala]